MQKPRVANSRGRTEFVLENKKHMRIFYDLDVYQMSVKSVLNLSVKWVKLLKSKKEHKRNKNSSIHSFCHSFIKILSISL